MQLPGRLPADALLEPAVGHPAAAGESSARRRSSAVPVLDRVDLEAVEDGGPVAELMSPVAAGAVDLFPARRGQHLGAMAATAPSIEHQANYGIREQE